MKYSLKDTADRGTELRNEICSKMPVIYRLIIKNCNNT